MPKSKSKRTRYQPPPKPKPKPSPRWYGVVVLGPIGIGITSIVVNYVGWPWETTPIAMWTGIGLIALGFALATRWR